MPQAASKYFGTVQFQLADLFHFRRGLPGFEEEVEFFAIGIPGQEPLLYLQSTRSPDLCLITLPARACRQDYDLKLSGEEREQLDLSGAADLQIGIDIACQAIITVDESHEPVANLAAPLVINLANRLGTQSFQTDPDYSFRHLISAAALSQSCS